MGMTVEEAVAKRGTTCALSRRPDRARHHPRHRHAGASSRGSRERDAGEPLLDLALGGRAPVIRPARIDPFRPTSRRSRRRRPVRKPPTIRLEPAPFSATVRAARHMGEPYNEAPARRRVAGRRCSRSADRRCRAGDVAEGQGPRPGPLRGEPGVAGFSMPDAQGNWTGFDTDFCRALAAAIFDDPKKIELISLSSKDRLIALQSGEIDVLAGPRPGPWPRRRKA